MGWLNMKDFQGFLDSIDHPDKRKMMEGILNHIKREFPHLKREIKWNQPMFTDHGTFILGFSVAKEHISVAPEAIAIRQFENEIREAGYLYTKNLFRIKWSDKVDYDLIHKIVSYNIKDKENTSNFWR